MGGLLKLSEHSQSCLWQCFLLGFLPGPGGLTWTQLPPLWVVISCSGIT